MDNNKNSDPGGGSRHYQPYRRPGGGAQQGRRSERRGGDFGGAQSGSQPGYFDAQDGVFRNSAGGGFNGQNSGGGSGRGSMDGRPPAVQGLRYLAAIHRQTGEIVARDLVSIDEDVNLDRFMAPFEYEDIAVPQATGMFGRGTRLEDATAVAEETRMNSNTGTCSMCMFPLDRARLNECRRLAEYAIVELNYNDEIIGLAPGPRSTYLAAEILSQNVEEAIRTQAEKESEVRAHLETLTEAKSAHEASAERLRHVEENHHRLQAEARGAREYADAMKFVTETADTEAQRLR